MNPVGFRITPVVPDAGASSILSPYVETQPGSGFVIIVARIRDYLEA